MLERILLHAFLMIRGLIGDFINCVIWRKQAENVANYLKKGSLAGVDGRVQTRSYDNNEGRRVFITEIVAESVQFLEPRGSNQGGNQGQNDFYGGAPELCRHAY